MKSGKKLILTAICALLLVVATVFGTMAWLTATTETVTNTFTFGNITMTLDEADVDDSTPNADRDIANTYKITPGASFDKDPTVHISAGSENCWLFVKVENGLADAEYTDEADRTTYPSIADQMLAKGWTKYDNHYWYKYNAAPGDHVVFEKVHVRKDLSSEQMENLKNATIKVTAYAIQLDVAEEGRPDTALTAMNFQNTGN